MQINNVADLVVETLAQAGVKRIFGVVGDSLNGITEALRRRKVIDWIHVRHEEGGGFRGVGRGANHRRACGLRRVVRAGQFAPHQRPVRRTSQPHARPRHSGANSVWGRSGGGYFQETHRRSCSANVATTANSFRTCPQLPYVLENAIRAAVGRRGVAVLVIPGDVALRKAPRSWHFIECRAAAGGSRCHARPG